MRRGGLGQSSGEEGEDWVSLQVRRGEDWVSLQVRRGRTGSVFR